MEYDLTIPGTDEVLCRDMQATMDANSSEDSPPRHSWRVTPSNLGAECAAQLWYKFRWTTLRAIPGRIARLFETGHESEHRFVAILRRMGWQVWDKDPAAVEKIASDPERYKHMNPQFKVSDFAGHLSGYLDGIGSHPIFTRGANVLLEFKTANEKNFRILVSKGVRVWSPKYYAQACIYMFYYNLPWTLFMVENKNDSEIVYRVVMRDDAHAREKLGLADTIVNSRSRPAKIAMSAAHHKCKFCDFVDQCHYDKPADVNCRSCQHCFAIEGGKFACDLYGPNIPEDTIKIGCLNHKSI